MGERHTCPAGSVTARALTTGRPSRHTTPTYPADVLGTHPARSTLVVPLSARGATLGVARFGRHRNPVPFDDEDLFLAQEIAARAAVAIDKGADQGSGRADVGGEGVGIVAVEGLVQVPADAYGAAATVQRILNEVGGSVFPAPGCPATTTTTGRGCQMAPCVPAGRIARSSTSKLSCSGSTAHSLPDLANESSW